MNRLASTFRVIIIFLLLVLCGLPLISKLDIKLNPEAHVSALTISFSWYNAEPRVVEQEATSVIEAIAARVQGIRRISSRSGRGTGRVTLTLDKKADADAIRFELSTLIRQAWSSMPPEVSYPVITVTHNDDEEIRPLLSYTLSAPDSASSVQYFAEQQMKPALASVEGISRVEVYGAMPKEWHVVYDPDRISSAGIKPEEITGAIGTLLHRQGIGIVRISPSGESLPVVIRTRNSDGNSLLQVPVKRNGERILRLSDVATISHTEAERQMICRINGLNTINILVYAAMGENNLTVATNVKEVMTSLESLLPGGYRLMLQDDSTDYIYDELRNIGIRTLIAFAGLIILVLLATRRWRYMLLIAVMLVGNLSIAVIFYYLAGLEIHLYALAGVTVSLGLMTDNIIIMTDHLRTRGNPKVILAILAGTLTTISSLTIIFFLGETIKANLTDFAMVVIINQSVSLFTTLFVIPGMLDLMKLGKYSGSLSPQTEWRRRRRVIRLTGIYGNLTSWLRKHRRWAVAILILGFGLPVYMLPARIEGSKPWHKAYNATFGSSVYSEKIKPVTDVLLGGTLRLFTEKVFEGSYFGAPQETYLYITAAMPMGTTIEQADATVAVMERFLSQFRQVRFFRSEITPRDATITVYFTREHQHSSFPYILKGDVISLAVETGGAYWNVSGFGDPFSNTVYEGTGEYYIRMQGYNYDRLSELAGQLSRMLMENPRNREVFIMSEPSWRRPDNVEFNMTIDKERALASGLPISAVTEELRERSLYQPLFATMKTPSGNENIRLRRGGADDHLWLIARAPAVKDSLFFRLEGVSRIVRETTAPVIARENQQYLMYLRFDFVGAEKTARRHIAENLEAFRGYLPLGYTAIPDPGRFYWFWQEDKSHYWLLGLIIVIIWFLCAILFESFLQPFAVIMTIPVGFAGLFLTFWIFRLNFDQGGFAAMLILCGITVNAAIYILNDFNTLVRANSGRDRSVLKLYLKAFNYKIIPILLTVISTVIGFIPFLIGERQPFWFALAAGTIGGVVFSIAGIIFCLPLFLRLKGTTKDLKITSEHEKKYRVMKNLRLFLIILSLPSFVWFSCNRTPSDGSAPSASEKTPMPADDAREVEVMVLKPGDFRRDIVSNGRLTALNKSDLEFKTRERIASIKVRNGDLVASGDIIASLDTFSLNNALLLSRDQYKKSLLEFQDLLLARGYSKTDTSLIPPAVVTATRVRSGLDKAIADLRMAEYNLEQANLRAPFRGIIADLFAHENEMSVPGKTFCSVIDNTRFVAYFPVLESEVSSLRKGQTVRIEPFITPGDAYPGKITSINPVVDNNGMVKIGAVADNRRGELFEGMNVKVIAGEVVGGQLVIPRQAVVLRSERKVVFTCSGGRAKWVYVTTGLENIDSYTVTEGLKEGDTVIVRGNFNLNHDSRVVIK